MKKLLFFCCKIILGGILVIIGVVSIFFLISFLRESQSAHEIAPNGEFIDMNDGGEIFITDTGVPQDATIILIHGTGSWGGIWKETIKELEAKNYRVITIDFPPFGYSTKYIGPDNYTREKQANRIRKVIEKRNLTNVHIIAHSIGARSAVELVMTGGSSIVQSLILIDPALGLNEQGQFQQNNPHPLVKHIFGVPILRHLLTTSILTNTLFTKKIFSGFVHNPASISAAQVKIIQQPYNLRLYSRGSADWIFSMFFSLDNSISTYFSEYKNITIPVCMIWGDLDTVTPLSQGYKLLQMIPESRLYIVKGVGHIPYIENVAAFHKELHNCLNRDTE